MSATEYDSPFITIKFIMRRAKRHSQTLTGQIEPITFKELVNRTQAIRLRAKTPHQHRAGTASTRQEKQSHNKTDFNFPNICEPETDTMLTKFNSIETSKKDRYETVDPKKFQRSRVKSMARTINLLEIPKEESTVFGSKQKIKDFLKKEQLISNKQKAEEYQVIYKRQINEFKHLYESLGNILSSIKQDINEVENYISDYLNYMETNNLSFIDDFIEGKERKIKKVIRDSRLQESLSVAYLFLEMAQQRIDNHESYLTNFLGYCLSNVLLTARIYMLKERREKTKTQMFEQAIREIESGSFGQPVQTIEEATFRMQHNNEIIVMMHKKLGRFNAKFESCIQLFFKQAERKKTSCVQCTHYIFQYLALHIHETDLLGISNCLQIAPVPYCAPPTKEYTLIIEPLGIIYANHKYRPYLFQFLEWAYKSFEIIMWTWEMPYEEEVVKVTQRLEPYLTAKLYRYHCMNIDNVWVKDLDRLGRPLEKTIIMDFDKRIFSRHPSNGIEMRWVQRGIQKDKGLLFLCQILQQMISTESVVVDTIRIYAQELYNISGL